MNILTIGLNSETIRLFNLLSVNSISQIWHTSSRENAISSIQNQNNHWDWIVLQGSDEDGYWRSVLCAIHARMEQTPVTILSSHIDGRRLKAPMCSISTDAHSIGIDHCALQSLLFDDRPATSSVSQAEDMPIVFSYHAPCR